MLFSNQLECKNYHNLNNIKPDTYNCITIDTRKSPWLTLKEIDTSLVEWQKQSVNTNDNNSFKIKAVWFKVGIKDTKWIPHLVERGFDFHHAIGKRNILGEYFNVIRPDENYLMMIKILNSTNAQNISIPSYAYTTIGVAGIVLHPDDFFKLNNCPSVEEENIYNSRLLMICEARSKNWKFPGGLAEQGEELSNTSCREVEEETGVKTKFEGILSFRHTHSYLFGCSDVYFVCILIANENNEKIEISPHEIKEAKWIKIKDLLNTPTLQKDISPSVHSLIKLYIKFLEDKHIDQKHNSLLLSSKKILSHDKTSFQTWYNGEDF